MLANHQTGGRFHALVILELLEFSMLKDSRIVKYCWFKWSMSFKSYPSSPIILVELPTAISSRRKMSQKLVIKKELIAKKKRILLLTTATWFTNFGIFNSSQRYIFDDFILKLFLVKVNKPKDFILIKKRSILCNNKILDCQDPKNNWADFGQNIRLWQVEIDWELRANFFLERSERKK